MPAHILMAGLLCLFLAHPAGAEEVRVAMASNFAAAMKALKPAFERQSSHRLVISSGATGRLHAQIVHGAPFDVFLAADAARPRRLEAEGRIVPGSRFTYALGRLVLYSRRAKLAGRRLRQALSAPAPARLAMANPRLAPYGRAARQALSRLGLWEGLKGRIVLGENVAQAFHFVQSGAADVGLVALSQVRALPGGERGAFLPVPEALHAPIRQQAVLLQGRPGAKAFLAFLRSRAARAIIRAAGYGTP